MNARDGTLKTHMQLVKPTIFLLTSIMLAVFGRDDWGV